MTCGLCLQVAYLSCICPDLPVDQFEPLTFESQRMDSPYAHLLRTNYVPDAPDRDAIRDFISTPITDLLRLDEEITHVKARYDILLAKREELSEIIDTHRALLSPARRLPPELVQEIFVACLLENRNPVMNSSEAPVLLGRICSAWRHIALTTAQLWSSLHVVVPNQTSHGEAALYQKIESVQMWLSRAGSFPLSISFFSPIKVDKGMPYDTASRLVRCLLPFSHRWKRIVFRAPWSVMQIVSRLHPDDVPLLEAIDIHIKDLDRTGLLRMEIWKEFDMLKTSRLQSLTLFSFHNTLRDVALCWGQFTVLDFSLSKGAEIDYCFTINETISMLAQCSKLISCTFYPLLPDENDPAHAPLTPIVLPNLQTMRLFEVGGSITYLDCLLTDMVAPVLRELEIGTIVNWFIRDMYEHPPFITLIQNPSSVLTTLALSTKSLTEEAILESLHHTPSLIRLQLTDAEPPTMSASPTPIIDDAFLRFLTLTQDWDCLCPNLEVLVLKHCSLFTDEALLILVEARAEFEHEGIAKLRRVKVSLYRDPEIDFLYELLPLREAGLEIYVRDLTVPRILDSPWEGLSDPESDGDDNRKLSSLASNALFDPLG